MFKKFNQDDSHWQTLIMAEVSAINIFMSSSFQLDFRKELHVFDSERNIVTIMKKIQQFITLFSL